MALEEKEGRRFLCVGFICLDIINVCKEFPKEDSDQRVLDQQWQRGGNASNNAAVLNMLRTKCDFFGTLSKAPSMSFIEKECQNQNICVESCVYLSRNDFPTSCVLINAENGSRTIVNCNNNWEEPTVEDFKKIDLSKYKWIHFEGRNAIEAGKMMDLIVEWNKSVPSDQAITISVELEKKKDHLHQLLKKVDFLFIGKMYAEIIGFTNMEQAVRKMTCNVKHGAYVICAWGEKGACGLKNGKDEYQLAESGIYPPTNGVVDTLGAGDTFLAGTIYHYHRHKSLEEAIKFGCKLAGAKCGVFGWNNLKNVCREIDM